MISDPDNLGSKLRWFCGEARREGPWLPRYSRVDGIGPRRWFPGRLWDRYVGRRAVWTCRVVRGHRVTVLRGARTKLKTFTVSNFDDKGKIVHRKEARLLRLGIHPGVTLTTQQIPVPVPPVELGHRFYFNRYEAL